MRQNPEFIISPLAGEHILVPVGKRAVDFNGVISLNKLGCEIWNILENDCSEADILTNVLNRYEVNEAQAQADISAFLEVLRQNGCILE